MAFFGIGDEEEMIFWIEVFCVGECAKIMVLAKGFWGFSGFCDDDEEGFFDRDCVGDFGDHCGIDVVEDLEFGWLEKVAEGLLNAKWAEGGAADAENDEMVEVVFVRVGVVFDFC